ncbi:spore photoproduct lyase [Clostridium thailandense]|uniref:Spore photoproduct lyase n=1 Tax=Clostridium thailandense TaxID=2794346 RepID=A0A949WQ22_9CLOT|nr:spore photoproduct lyase [Clostridium thailandense]MBV7272135.1 spore photoproduct lyase [Clostridium thailandense]MCH5136013.1 spore photoproduct lyase [Clostridiaceae bacterium UIB06]
MFIPKRVIFEKDSLDYEMGKSIYEKFKDSAETEIINLNSNKVKQHIPGEDLASRYREGKKTLVVGVKKSLKFQTCKPSANYQLPIVSGCIGQCEYCYLNTNLGDKPFTRVHVNLDEILRQAQDYIDERLPENTIFEGSATSDPVPVEPYTNSLRKTIEFFGRSKNGKFRFVTKYNDIDGLLNIEHNGNTEIRFTLNTDKVISEYENRTASRDSRIEASVKIAEAGYPIGFIIAPVFLYDNWKEEYRNLLLKLNKQMPNGLAQPIIFEVISHRYTTRAKNIILEVFPNTKLPMVDEERKFKYGQFGYGKYIYTKEQLDDMKEFFNNEIEAIFTNKIIKYII